MIHLSGPVVRQPLVLFRIHSLGTFPDCQGISCVPSPGSHLQVQGGLRQIQLFLEGIRIKDTRNACGAPSKLRIGIVKLPFVRIKVHA